MNSEKYMDTKNILNITQTDETDSVSSPINGITGREETHMWNNNDINIDNIDLDSMDRKEEEFFRKWEQSRKEKESVLNHPKMKERGLKEFHNLMKRYGKSDWRQFLSYLGVYERKERKEVTNEIIDEVLKLHGEGIKQTEICKILELGESSVSRIINGKITKKTTEEVSQTVPVSETINS